MWKSMGIRCMVSRNHSMKSHILLLNGGKKKFSADFKKHCAAQNAPCESIRAVHAAFHVTNGSTEVFVSGSRIDLSSFSSAFIRVRGIATHTSALLLELLRGYGVPFNDPLFAQHTLHIEKISQMILLARAGIPVPRSWIFSKTSLQCNRDYILASISYPCVLKTNGSHGRAVWKIDSEDHLFASIESITEELMILQEYIPNTFDIRALYLFGKCLGAISRSATDGFHNNISHGGTADIISLTPEEQELGLRACTATGIDFGGVDIVRTKNGPLFFEVNAGPQIYGFEKITGISVGAEVALAMLRKSTGNVH